MVNAKSDLLGDILDLPQTRWVPTKADVSSLWDTHRLSSRCMLGTQRRMGWGQARARLPLSKGDSGSDTVLKCGFLNIKREASLPCHPATKKCQNLLD